MLVIPSVHTSDHNFDLIVDLIEIFSWVKNDDIFIRGLDGAEVRLL